MRNYKKSTERIHPVDYTNWEESIAIFGCSCTYGHYLEPEHHLHNVIESDRPINNFSYPGESNWHMWMKAIDVIKESGMPHRICIGWTSPYRIALYNEGKGSKERIIKSIADTGFAEDGKWSSKITSILNRFWNLHTVCISWLLKIIHNRYIL